MTRRRKKKPGTLAWWSDKQRIQAVQTWLATGNLTLTAATLEIPESTMRRWKAAPWWKELVDEIRTQESVQLDNKLSKVVERSVDQLLDRVENGDFQYDQKTGQLVRKPISAKDAVKVTTEVLDRRDILQGKKETQTESKVVDRLEKLAEEFIKFANAKVVENIKPKVIEDAIEVGEIEEGNL